MITQYICDDGHIVSIRKQGSSTLVEVDFSCDYKDEDDSLPEISFIHKDDMIINRLNDILHLELSNDASVRKFRKKEWKIIIDDKYHSQLNATELLTAENLTLECNEGIYIIK